jgi:hypothetical protein
MYFFSSVIWFKPWYALPHSPGNVPSFPAHSCDFPGFQLSRSLNYRYLLKGIGKMKAASVEKIAALPGMTQTLAKNRFRPFTK